VAFLLASWKKFTSRSSQGGGGGCFVPILPAGKGPALKMRALLFFFFRAIVRELFKEGRDGLHSLFVLNGKTVLLKEDGLPPPFFSSRKAS